MNVTLDGFMAGPHAELDWHFRSWSDDMAASISSELAKADTIILGRVTYSAMENYWPSQSTCLTLPREDVAFAEMMNRYKKIVVSTTLHRTQWHNSEIISKNIPEQINKLKRSEGRDMIVYGSGKLVATLVRAQLVDEFLLWVHPVLLGKGKSFFTQVDRRLILQLVQRMSFSSGVVALRYRVQNSKSQIPNHKLKTKLQI
jgi:dihydrofolate reductase